MSPVTAGLRPVTCRGDTRVPGLGSPAVVQAQVHQMLQRICERAFSRYPLHERAQGYPELELLFT